MKSLATAALYSALIVWGTARAHISNTPRAPSPTATPARNIDTFTLTATERNFAQYYPTYLANGYWSAASSLLGTQPTVAYMVGLMDNSLKDVSRPAAIPSWNEIDYFNGAKWLNHDDINRQTHTRYRQTLDMHDGLLRTQYRWTQGRRATDLSVISFVSQSSPHLAVVSLSLVPRFSGRVRLRFTLQTPPPPNRLPLAQMTAAEFGAAAASLGQTTLASGGNRDAIWYPGQVDIVDSGGDTGTDSLYVAGKAIRGAGMALAAAVELPAGPVLHKIVQHTPDGVALEVDIDVKRDHRYQFVKFLSSSSEGWGGGAADDLEAARQARHQGFTALLAAHTQAWHALWRSDIRVGGNPALQRTVHSDLFYLLENSTVDSRWPVGACGFSSHYFGHVFWDNDLWVFPSLLLLHPQRARSLIQFRQDTLPQARARAKAHGFEGAMYPWEADPASGEDVTPAFAIANADREIHVNGAVALAQWQYYLASRDHAWLRDRAFPVIEAVADFWSSRVSFAVDRHRFELLGVTSPEEDYTDVDNEIYTNVVAQRSLVTAIQAAKVLGVAPHPKWSEVAGALYLPTAGHNGRYDDFDPRTPHDKTNSWMATSVPMLSIPAVDFEAGRDALKGLFDHSMAAIEPVRARANQMVLLMIAIEAADLGMPRNFAQFVGASGSENDPFLKPPFNIRSETPQNASTYLLASSGGFLQAFVYGLTGLRLEEDGLMGKYGPMLPDNIASLELKNIEFRGERLDVEVTRLPTGEVVRRMMPALPGK